MTPFSQRLPYWRHRVAMAWLRKSGSPGGVRAKARLARLVGSLTEGQVVWIGAVVAFGTVVVADGFMRTWEAPWTLRWAMACGLVLATAVGTAFFLDLVESLFPTLGRWRRSMNRRAQTAVRFDLGKATAIGRLIHDLSDLPAGPRHAPLKRLQHWEPWVLFPLLKGLEREQVRMQSLDRALPPAVKPSRTKARF